MTKDVKRYLSQEIEDLVLKRHKMLFLSGPRQCGKTTLAKSLLSTPSSYFNWDDLKFKNQWLKNNESIAELLLKNKHPRCVFDEFHKNPKWKNQIKAFYDIYGDKIQIILTGSAHLNVYRRGSDSLLGRFVHLRLHPFTYGELFGQKNLDYPDWLSLITHLSRYGEGSIKQQNWSQLFEFGGFPEPFLAANKKIHQVWLKSRFELLIRQDLADSSPFLHANQVELLAALLPQKVGSILSVQSLREDLDVAHTTVSRWLEALKLVYFHFDVSPYSKNITRSLKKDKKIYLFDWSAIEDKGHRFENMVACHLKKMVDYYSDTGQADLQLHYLRDKEQHEVDFIITEKNKPILSIEVKLSELNLDKTFLKFRKKDQYPHIQIVGTQNIFRFYKEANAAVISFCRFFNKLP